MSTDLATRPTGALAVTSDQDAFTEAQLEAYGIAEATRGEQLVFLHAIQKTGLDPAARQIYMIGRWDRQLQRDRYTVQTGIDGYRLIADRTGLYAGSEEAWTDGPGRFPVSATVTVWKFVRDQLRPFKATAHWDEYVQTNRDGSPSRMWARMPRLMLAKCAEALALRKAFPQELSGIYTAEEMAQADAGHVEVRIEPEPATPARGVPVQDATTRTQELQQVALRAAADATGMGSREDLVALWNSVPKPCIPLDVRVAITDAQLAAAAVHVPDLDPAAQHVPLLAWLQACAACIKEGGTSVRDASIYDEPEDAEAQETTEETRS